EVVFAYRFPNHVAKTSCKRLITSLKTISDQITVGIAFEAVMVTAMVENFVIEYPACSNINTLLKLFIRKTNPAFVGDACDGEASGVDVGQLLRGLIFVTMIYVRPAVWILGHELVQVAIVVGVRGVSPGVLVKQNDMYSHFFDLCDSFL